MAQIKSSPKRTFRAAVMQVVPAAMFTALCVLGPTAAQADPHDDSLGDSLARDSTFTDTTLSRDTDFGRQSYRDSLDLMRRLEKHDNSFKVEQGVLAGDSDKYGIRPFRSGGMLIDGRLEEELVQLRKPILEVSGDWVPDKLDPTDNGGFEVSPDNGSPVPYRLNGHVDIQRGRPWDIDN